MMKYLINCWNCIESPKQANKNLSEYENQNAICPTHQNIKTSDKSCSMVEKPLELVSINKTDKQHPVAFSPIPQSIRRDENKNLTVKTKKSSVHFPRVALNCNSDKSLIQSKRKQLLNECF